MFPRIALVCLIAAAPFAASSAGGLGATPSGVQEQGQENRKVPKDSILVVINGCVKGRVLKAADVRQVDSASGFDVRQRTFRLAGKKDVMNDVKTVDGQRAEVTGLIKKSALIRPGVSVMGGRVRIGAGTSGGSTGSLPDPAEDVAVLDVTNVQGVGGSCGG